MDELTRFHQKSDGLHVAIESHSKHVIDRGRVLNLKHRPSRLEAPDYISRIGNYVLVVDFAGKAPPSKQLRFTMNFSDFVIASHVALLIRASTHP